MIKLAALTATLLVLCMAGARAQTGRNYNVQGMNFDMWCQEQAHLLPDRCDKRTAEDEKRFEKHRNRVDRYEVPYLQEQQSNLAVHRDIMENDPVDNPVSQDPEAQMQDRDRQPPTALP